MEHMNHPEHEELLVQAAPLVEKRKKKKEKKESDKPTEKDEVREELEHALRDSSEVLATTTAVLSIFPDTVTLDRTKLTVTKRRFFSTAETITMRVEDILNVTANVGPLFGTLKINSRALNIDKPISVGRFWREETLHFKRIAQGYVIVMQRKIDCTSLGTGELIAMFDKLGDDADIEPSPSP